MTFLYMEIVMALVIALCGAENRGKTTTLTKLIKILQNNGAEIAPDHEIKIGAEDFMVYLRYKSTTMCICTGGDVKEALRENIKFFRKFPKSNIYISATRLKGVTCTVLDDFAKNNGVVWFVKTHCHYDENYSYASELDVREILACLKEEHDVFKEIDLYA